jgi:hypothetical protein
MGHSQDRNPLDDLKAAMEAAGLQVDMTELTPDQAGELLAKALVGSLLGGLMPPAPKQRKSPMDLLLDLVDGTRRTVVLDECQHQVDTFDLMLMAEDEAGSEFMHMSTEEAGRLLMTLLLRQMRESLKTGRLSLAQAALVVGTVANVDTTKAEKALKAGEHVTKWPYGWAPDQD